MGKSSYPFIYLHYKSYEGQSRIDNPSTSVKILKFFKVCKFIALNLNDGLLLDEC